MSRIAAADNIVVRYMAVVVTFSSFFIVDSLVIVVVFWVDGDDVPGVYQAGNVAENAEEDIYEGVRRADARFDPD